MRLLELNLFILEQGTEKKDFESQSFHHTSCGIRAVNIIGFDPGERFLLARDRRDVKGNGRTRPFQDAVNKSDDEKDNGHVRNEDTKDGIEAYSSYANKDEKEKDKNA